MRKFYGSQRYKQLPIALQNAFVTIKGCSYSFVRNGLYPGALRKKVLAAETLDEEQIRASQYRNLVSLVTHAHRHVPYYRKKFAEIGFHPGDLKSIEDLSLLPVITKEIVRENADDFFAENFRGRNLVDGATSGTTGSSLKLKMDGNLIHLEHAFALRQFRWAGFPRRGGRCALLRGDMIVPAEQSLPPFWRYDAWSREMWFSSYHISEASAPSYLSELEKFDPHLIFAYPSAIFSLSQFAAAAGRKPAIPSLKGIVTSSETLYEYQCRNVSETFGVKIFDWYGMFERVIFIGTCEEGRYHVFPDYGITEFLPSGSDEFGVPHHELVGTGFLNRVVPLIRYRTGDTVELPDRSIPCGCGRHFPQVKSIVGRIDDEIATPDGRRLSVIVMVFKSITGIRLAQIIQDSIDALTVLVVPGPGYTDAEEAHLIANLRERTGAGMRIEVKRVASIAQGKNGKIKTVVSNLPKGKLNHMVSEL